MKNFIFMLLFACFFQVTSLNAQELAPESWSIPTIDKVVPIQLEKPDLTTLIAEDAVNDLDKSIPWRFGYDHSVDYSLDNAGQWYELPNGDRIWRINVISPEALTMNILFHRYKVPIGGKYTFIMMIAHKF